MSDSKQVFEAGTYVKGDHRRLVETAADAVSAKFDGFVLSEAREPDEDVEPSSAPVPDVDNEGGDPAESDVDVDGSRPNFGTFTV